MTAAVIALIVVTDVALTSAAWKLRGLLAEADTRELPHRSRQPGPPPLPGIRRPADRRRAGRRRPRRAPRLPVRRRTPATRRRGDVMDAVNRTAQLSTDGRYRYLLSRTWDPNVEPCGWIMLNPSTADAEEDDPTIRRCMGFARSWGHGGIVVANLYAYRATDPDDLVDAAGAGVDPVGPANAEAILELFGACRVVVCAWGSTFVSKRGWRLARLNVEGMALRYDDRALFCLGRTKSGHPRHPLYVAGHQELVAMA